MAKKRYRAIVGIDIWGKDWNMKSWDEACKEVCEIMKSIPNSILLEVKPLPHGSDNILSKEIINEI